MFPVGSYTFSNGMETYTQRRIIHDKVSLGAFLKSQAYILPYSDIGIATKVAQGNSFIKLDHMCGAMKQPQEVRMASEKLWARLLKEIARLNEYPSLLKYQSAIKERECDGHYPVAIGLLILDLGVDIKSAMEMYAYSTFSIMVNHAVKLVPLGQKDGQTELFKIMKYIPNMIETALNTSINDLGVSGCGFDLRSMQHESLHGRLFTS